MLTRTSTALALLLPCIALGQTGCARSAKVESAPRLVDLRGPDETDDLVRMTDDLLHARVVYVGEQHDRGDHHAVQLSIIQALHARDRSLAIGMEMFEAAFQDALDAWIEGRIDEEELRASTEYDERWGYDFALYRPILEFARAEKIPIVALNASGEITRTVARDGLDALTEEQRANVPTLVLDDRRHRALVEEALRAHHGMSPELLERFYLVQVIWDETMAASVADVLAGIDAPRRMVVLAGRMHVERGLGIPERAARRGAEPYRIVLPVDAVERATASSDEGGRRAADWLWLTTPETAESPPRPRDR